MKTMTFADSRNMTSRENVFIRALKPAKLLRRFQRYIVTSDWDEQIIRKQPVFDKLCWGVVILSGLTISPFIVAALLK
jgi:hypothetical protein